MLKVIRLSCEYRVEPLGLDEARPRFSWQLQATARGVAQAAYRLQLFCEDGENPDWDSGRVASRSMIHAPYTGPALSPRTRYRYRVRVWDRTGRDSGFSDFACFETGLISAEGNRAQWIGARRVDAAEGLPPALRFRHEIEIADARVVRARVYASALGVYSMTVNGQPAGEALLSPGFTSYGQRVQYQTWDVTNLLRAGANALAVVVGDGWYRGSLVKFGSRNHFGDRLALIAQLHVRYEDGREDVFCSDESWRFDEEGPVRWADLYAGIEYDARRDDRLWREPGFDEGAWRPVAILNHPKSAIVGQLDPPIVRRRVLAPSAVITTPRGELVLDMGQNMVGWLRFRVRGPAGHRVVVSHAETLDRDGNFYTENYRSARSQIVYTLRGDAEERFEPDLTFFGFRYVRLENWPCAARASDFEGVVIHSDLEEVSGFECSDERVNQLFHNIQWSQRGNFVDVPTDCPQRDERLGWTGDLQMFARTACINMNCAAMLSEWLKDLACDQSEDGSVPHVVPDVLGSGGSAAWGDAAVIVPWTLYQCYGDERVLRRQYPSMKKWLQYIEAHSTDYLWDAGEHFGDWLALDAREGDYVGATDKVLIATAYAAYDALIMQMTAELLGHEKDAADYKNRYRNTVRAFRREFFTPNGRLAVPTQTAHALALHFELVEEKHRPRIVRDLIELIAKAGGRLTTGFVGTPYLCLALTASRAHEVAGQLFMQTACPSWLYPITRGATTMWEHWDGIKPDGSFWSRDMNSFNHYAYGAIGEWMIRGLAGIDMAECAYQRLLLHPRPIDELNFVSAWQMTPCGRAHCEWRLDGDNHIVRCTVPAGVEALLVLERAQLRQVTEGGRLLSDARGVERAWQSEEDVMIALQSGDYTFEWRVVNA